MPTYAIRYRRDTTANWIAANPILLDGEMGYERTDDGRLLCKMGDGVLAADGTITGTHWVDLPYVSGPAGPSPEFEWAGTSLRFKNPDGTWGEWIDLQGAQGLQGVQGIPGPTGESVPATESTLGGIMVGGGLAVTAEGCLAVKADGVTTQVDETGLLSALGGNLLLNSEEWITASGEWIAPVSSWYEVLLFGGGSSGGILVPYYVVAGASGAIKSALVYLEAGQEVPVVIGAGGPGFVSQTQITTSVASVAGGDTSFGAVTTAGEMSHYPRNTLSALGNKTYWATMRAYAPGLGAGADGTDSFGHFGAGGSARWDPNRTDSTPGYPYDVVKLGSGAQGSVRVRWHDPAKANGSLPAPALFAARRMARAVAEPAVVNLYDPETGQGSVWREEDAPAKLAEGLITEAAWQAMCAEKAAEERAAWLASPDTEAERFEMLRRERESRLAATDYLVAQDYPLTDAQRAAVTAYRQALRDLPAQADAPWDGGGKGTPWPAEPACGGEAPALSDADDA